MKVDQWSLAVLLSLAMIGCTKEEDKEPTIIPTTSVEVTVNHLVDGVPLNFNTSQYSNDAGNVYSVSRLEYYLGDFAFLKTNGEWTKPENLPVLINAENGSASFSIMNVIPSDYTGFTFLIGLPTPMNSTGYLEDNLGNLNMAWPPSMGGGYHFLKLEGNYTDDTQVTRGFTIHIGGEGHQSRNQFTNIDLSLSPGLKTSIIMDMNINEWFNNPHLYDFNKEGNYSMGIDSLMQKLSENGQNSFELKIAK